MAFLIGHVPWNKGVKGKKPWMKLDGLKIGHGWFRGKEMVQIQGEKHPFWAGDDVKYRGLHKWLKRRLGTPNKCQKCGLHASDKVTKDGRSYIQWANLDHSYKRDLNDYVPLCYKCHRAHDKQINL